MKKINLALAIAFLLILVGFIFIGISEYKKNKQDILDMCLLFLDKK